MKIFMVMLSLVFATACYPAEICIETKAVDAKDRILNAVPNPSHATSTPPVSDAQHIKSIIKEYLKGLVWNKEKKVLEQIERTKYNDAKRAIEVDTTDMFED